LGNINQIKQAYKSSKKHEVIPISKSEIFRENKELTKISDLTVNILKPHGSIFFGSVEHMLETYSEASKHQILIIDMGNVGMVDLTGIYALEDLINSLRKKNIEVFITKTDPTIKDLLDKTGFIATIGSNHFSDDSHSILTTINKYQN
jgi:Sulfate permease and related transporters (MFS superfamily)